MVLSVPGGSWLLPVLPPTSGGGPELLELGCALRIELGHPLLRPGDEFAALFDFDIDGRFLWRCSNLLQDVHGRSGAIGHQLQCLFLLLHLRDGGLSCVVTWARDSTLLVMLWEKDILNTHWAISGWVVSAHGGPAPTRLERPTPAIPCVASNHDSQGRKRFFFTQMKTQTLNFALKTHWGSHLAEEISEIGDPANSPPERRRETRDKANASARNPPMARRHVHCVVQATQKQELQLPFHRKLGRGYIAPSHLLLNPLVQMSFLWPSLGFSICRTCQPPVSATMVQSCTTPMVDGVSQGCADSSRPLQQSFSRTLDDNLCLWFNLASVPSPTTSTLDNCDGNLDPGDLRDCGLPVLGCGGEEVFPEPSPIQNHENKTGQVAIKFAHALPGARSNKSAKKKCLTSPP